MGLLAVVKTVGFVLMGLAWSVCFVVAVPFSQLRYVLLRACKKPYSPVVDAIQWVLRLPYSFVVWSFANLCLGCMGIAVRHVDEESEKNWREARTQENSPHVVAFQHVCIADPLVAGALFPEGRFVMKRELKVIFFIFYAAVANGFIDVARNSPESRAECTSRMIDTVKLYQDCLALAPEGTRNKNDPLQLLPFKKGAFIVSTNTGAPVIPLVHFYAERCWADRAYSRFMPRQSIIAVKVLPAIYPKKDESVEDLQERVRAAMQAELDKGKPDESIIALTWRDRLRLILFPVTVFAFYALCIIGGIWLVRGSA